MKKRNNKINGLKKVPYKKPPKPNFNCHTCGEKGTHVVLLELRDKPGVPLKENNVLHFVCEEHINRNFDFWVPNWAFKGLCNEWKNAGFILDKKYCTINIIPFKK